MRYIHRTAVLEDDCPEIVGTSAAIQNIKALLRKMGPTNSTVLITGETGTGKDATARLIHRLSPRNKFDLVAVNCTAIPETLLESELFGYEKGAFTGANHSYVGKFQLADRGTLFLDEIGDLSSLAQCKLLRALEEHEVQPLGGRRPIAVDLRVITATHQDLERLVEEEKFRSDLYYRLNVVRIHMPPLRHRREDIPLLANHILAQLNGGSGRCIEGFTKQALDELTGHPWPGNVRQLRNVIEAATFACESKVITRGDIRAMQMSSAPKPSYRYDMPSMIHTAPAGEMDALKRALEYTDWNFTHAASILNWSRMTLYRKVSKYGLMRPAGQV